MRLLFRALRGRPPALVAIAIVFLIVSWSLFVNVHYENAPSARLGDAELERRFPLAWKHIQSSRGKGGAWYMPPEWVDGKNDPPKTIVDAARFASRVAMSDPAKQMRFSKVPLLVHQTWKNTRVNTWDVEVISWVERWLEYSVSSQHGPMAYFLWDNDGLAALLREFEPSLFNQSLSLFSPVEQADIFRIAVCKWIGGIYGDLDTAPLQPPSAWIHASDIAAWTDETTGKSYGHPLPPDASPDSDFQQDRPVNIVLGLEADTDPNSDSYWRMGYEYPVQLTQWALASAPQHPVLSRFMDDLDRQVQGVRDKVRAQSPANLTAALRKEMSRIDPLTLTGPAAITLSTMTWLEEQVGLRWESVTGLKDGGRAKLVSDVLVLPITAFSPGRGKYGNMGSKPLTDPDARLVHHARGSWRHFDVVVEIGKFCRTVFGLCRDWTKVPT